MKGLLIKDFKLLKNQKSFLAIVAAVCAFVMIKGSESYAMFYGAAMAAMLSVNSIGYDEENNGMGFLFTLPVSRRDYVLENTGLDCFCLELYWQRALCCLPGYPLCRSSRWKPWNGL